MKRYSFEEGKSLLSLPIDLSKSIYKAVPSEVTVDVFEDKDPIVTAYEPITRLFLLVEGKGKISILHEDGHRSIINFLRHNEIIGDLTLIGIEKEPKDVISIGRSICLSIPMATAEKVLLKDADFLLMLNRYIGRKLLSRTWFSAKHQHYELKHRLAGHILRSEYKGLYTEKHTETAEYLAVSYRHLLHTLNIFKQEGLVTKTKAGYTFNRQALEDLASVLEPERMQDNYYI